MPDTRLRRFEAVRPFAVAAAAVAISTVVRVLVQPILGDIGPFVLFFPAVTLAGWYGGLVPGLMATALSSVAGAVLVLPLAGTSVRWMLSNDDSVRLLLFITVGVFISAMSGAMHRARRTAEQHEQLWRITIRSIGDAVVVAGEDGRVSFLNPVAERITGWDESSARGRRLSDVVRIVDGRSREGLSDCDQWLHREGPIASFGDDTWLLARDGTERPVSASGAPIRDDEDRAAGVVLVFRDVSEQRQSDAEREALLARERDARAHTEAGSLLKDDFLATLSHELRTPLNAVLGWARLLGSGQLTGEKATHAVATVERNAAALASMIEDMLDVSRIMRGSLRIQPVPLDLAPVVESAIESVRPAAAAKNIRLILDIAADHPPIAGEPARVQQVVWNLLSNAVKFTQAGGRVDISVSHSGSMVELSVRDDGAGIAPDFLPHVFERFRQGDAGTDRRRRGLGLGLAIVRDIVELHGGSIRVESAGEGHGSTFTAQFPAIDDATGSPYSHDDAGATSSHG